MSGDFLAHQTVLSLSEVAKLLPRRNGKKIHYSTLYRWATKGVRGRILGTVMIGGIRYTSVEALERFTSTKLTRTAAVGIGGIDAVNQALDAAGL